jgi:hypothetical protein
MKEQQKEESSLNGFIQTKRLQVDYQTGDRGMMGEG